MLWPLLLLHCFASSSNSFVCSTAIARARPTVDGSRLTQVAAVLFFPFIDQHQATHSPARAGSSSPGMRMDCRMLSAKIDSDPSGMTVRRLGASKDLPE